MTPVAQRRLAIIGALLCVAGFVAANLHLVVVAIKSQPACAVVGTSQLPARRDC